MLRTSARVRSRGVHVSLLLAASLAGLLPCRDAASAAAGEFRRPAGYQYVAPLPGSRLIPTGTSITVRTGSILDPAALDPARWQVRGSVSGDHDGALSLSSDRRTLTFRPRVPFARGERVSVTLDGGGGLPPLALSFEITPGDPRALRERALRAGFGSELARAIRDAEAAARARAVPAPVAAASQRAASLADSLPASYWPITLVTSNQPDPGAVFMAPFGAGSAIGRLLIVDDRAKPLFYRAWPSLVFDFKRQSDGRLTFFSAPSTFYAMDSTYTVVDSFRTGNGYEADEHELQLLPNGHALLMAYDAEPYPMDTAVPGGRADAIVIGLVLQELDESKNVVFQWRSWDHFKVTDMIECTGVLTDSIIDAVHANAIEPDQDGNLLLSSRHLCEITKIDRQSGDVMWRMGLNAKNNDFTFLDDPRGFSHQHDIRRQPNGHLTLFDNGNCLSPPGPFYSRAVEYEVDEVNRTARLVWEYRHTPDLFGPFMGNQQRRDGGAMTICWGGTFADPRVTELHSDGSTAFELGLGLPARWTYRAFRFPWQTTAFVADDSLDLGEVSVDAPTSRRLGLTNRLATPITLNQFLSTDPAFTVLEDSLHLEPGATDSVTVRFLPTHLHDSVGDLYVRSVNDTGLIARVVHLHGVGVSVGVTIDDVRRPEGQAGETTPFVFTVRLTPPAVDSVTIDFATEDSTATTTDNDYVAASGTLVFAPGDSVATITVDGVGDSIPEYDQVFKVVLSQPLNAVLDRAVGYGTLASDEGVLAVGEWERGFALHAIQPNPARARAAITFDLPRAVRASLEVFDVRGRRVATLVSGWRPAGRNEVTWRTDGRAAGVYFVRLEAARRALTRRVVITR